jgi:hypothetical protein
MPEPNVRDMLIVRIDDLVAAAEQLLGEITEVCDQLEPDRAHSCGNAIGMAGIMLDEIRLRAHAQPMTGRVGEERRLLDRIEGDD